MLIKQTTQMTDSERIATENSNNQFLQSLSFVAVGTIYPFAGSTIPDTFMLCDGSALDTTEYSELFSVIGHTYGGSGDSFNIPDLRGKVLVGCDSSDTSFDALGKKGGAKEVKLTVAQMPEHEGHLYQNVTDIEAGPPPIGNLAGYLNESTMTAHSSSGRGWNLVAGNEVVPAGVSRGGDQPHENMPPYMVCNYIIKVNQGISTDDFRLPIDQTYTPTSPNAQSGIATAEAVGVANDYTDKAIKSLKTYANNTFAPAIKNTVSGSVLAVHDVSPAEHDLDVCVRSENLIPYPYYQSTSSANGGMFTVNDDRSVTASGTPTAYIEIKLYQGKPLIISGTVTASILDISNNLVLELVIQDSDNNILATNSGTKSFTMDVTYPNAAKWTITIKRGTSNKIISGTVFPKLQIGETATEYTDYVDVEGIEITLTDGTNIQTGTVNEDGKVEGFTSLSPDMSVTSDIEGVIIDCTYNADTKLYIDNKLAEISTAIVNNV